MKNQDFTSVIKVSQKPAEVFKILLDVRAWWSGLYEETFKGTSDKVGDEFSFLAGGGAHYSKQKLVEITPAKKIVWKVIESNLTFLNEPEEWLGTEIIFELSEETDGTKIIFTHKGLDQNMECYDSCAPAWTQYIQEQLKNILMTTKQEL